MATLIETITALPQVAKVAAWKDRSYVTFTAAEGSRANADLRAKIWAKDGTLTIEPVKGYHSDEFIAAKYAMIDAVEAAGFTVRAL